MGGHRWEVGVSFNGDCAAGVRIDVPAVWRADFEPDELACSSQNLSFALPLDLGRFTGEVNPQLIEGSVSQRDGSKVRLTLAPAAHAAVKRETLEIDNGDVHIAGTLVSPITEGPYPAIIVLHGGGDSTRDAPPYRFWGDFLARRGFAVYLYDKRGNGSSSSNWRNVGFDPRADDVRAILESLSARPEIAKNRIGVLAVSQGGWVAARADAITEGLAFFATVSSPTVTPLQADTFALSAAMRGAGLSEAEVGEVLALWSVEADLIRHLDSTERWAAYEAAVEAARQTSWWEKSGYSPLTRDSWFGPWYAQVLDFDPQPLLARSQTPSLWLYGRADTQSDVAENARILDELAGAGAPVEFRVYEGGDHGVLVSHGAGGAFPAAADGFFDDLLAWIEARSAG